MLQELESWSALVVAGTPWVRLGLRLAIVEARARIAEQQPRRLIGEPTDDAIAEASDPASALALAIRNRPALLVLHLTPTAEDEAVRLIAALAEREPKTQILIVGESLDQETIVRLLEAGVCGCIGAEVSDSDLIAAIERVRRGERVLGPGALGGIIERVVRNEREQRLELDRLLSARERQVLRRLAEGWTTRAIANELFVAETTVKTYIQRAIDKLRVSSRAEAIAQAAKRGLLD